MRRLGSALVAALLAVAVAGSLAACGDDGDDGNRIVLDGSPRVPSAEGVVTEVDREHIVLDGGRRYRLADEPQSFSTYTMAQVSLLERKGQYVHVGVDGDRVTWVASIGAVTRIEPPVVFYNGVLERLDGRRLVFRDGTVLQLADGVKAPVSEGFVRAEIDPEAHRVRRVAAP